MDIFGNSEIDSIINGVIDEVGDGVPVVTVLENADIVQQVDGVSIYSIVNSNSSGTFDLPVVVSNISNNTSNLSNHTTDSTIHFTKGSIDHTGILNVGTNSHDQIDSHLADNTIHFTKGSIDHTGILNIGINSHAQIDSHLADTTVHFTKGSIDHTGILNVGTNSHAQIDSHLADTIIHFTKGSIYHTEILNIGTNSHAQIDSHIADSTIHFTKGSIDHTGILNVGTNSHAQIDSFISSKGQVSGLCPLNSSSKIDATYLTINNLNYLGAWNATTNTPTLTNGSGTNGAWYMVSVSGTTTIDGISVWEIGDKIVSNGIVWEKIETYEAVNSVNSKTGIITLNSDDISQGSINLYYTTALSNLKYDKTGGDITGAVSLNYVNPVLSLKDSDAANIELVQSDIKLTDNTDNVASSIARHTGGNLKIYNYTTTLGSSTNIRHQTNLNDLQLSLVNSNKSLLMSGFDLFDLGGSQLRNGTIRDNTIVHSDLTASSIVETGVSSNLITAVKGTAYNKSFGTGTTNVPQIGATLGNTQIVETNGTGQLITAVKGTAYNKAFATPGNYDSDTVLQGSDLNDNISTTENLYSGSKINSLITIVTTNANGRVLRTGDTMTGILNMGGNSIILGDIKTYYDTKYTIQHSNILLETPMTANNAPVPYVASQSSTFGGGFEAWRAFDGIYATQSYSLRNRYSDVTGYAINGVAAQTTLLNTSVIDGEWIQLDMGVPYEMNGISYNTAATQYIPDDYMVLGSNTNTVGWVALDTVVGNASGKVINTTYRNNFTLSAPYRYFRFILQRTVIGGWGGTAGLSFRSLDIHTKKLDTLIKASVEITDSLTVNNVLQDTGKDIFIVSEDTSATKTISLAANVEKILNATNSPLLVVNNTGMYLSDITPDVNSFSYTMNEPGWYKIDANANFNNNANNPLVGFALYHNGVRTRFSSNNTKTSGIITGGSINAIININAGDTLSLCVISDLVVILTYDYTTCIIRRIRTNT